MTKTRRQRQALMYLRVALRRGPAASCRIGTRSTSKSYDRKRLKGPSQKAQHGRTRRAKAQVAKAPISQPIPLGLKCR